MSQSRCPSIHPYRVLGIDPGKCTGLADVHNGEITLQETTFWGAFDYVTWLSRSVIDLVVIEVSTDTYVWHAKGKGSVAAAARTGQHVGAVRREGELLAEGLRSQGYNVKTVPPRGKMDARAFSLCTGYQGQTNEHKRDAGMMAWAEYQRLKQLERVRV